MGDQTPWAAPQVDGRPVTHPDDSKVERCVGVVAAEPAAYRQGIESAVVVAQPAALAVKGAVVEVTEHVTRPWSPARTGRRAHMRGGPPRHRGWCRHRPMFEPGSRVYTCRRAT